MWLMSWVTRWSMGAVEVTHGQLAEDCALCALAAFAGAAWVAATVLTAVAATAPSVTARHRSRRGFPAFLASVPRFRIFPPR
jgi:hypothetical protein